MFLVYCAICDRRTLLGVDEVDWVENLTGGVISVAGRCPRGHDVVVLTGDAFTPHQDPRHFGPPPRPWTKPLGRLRTGVRAWFVTKPLGRLRTWVRTRFELSRDLPSPFYRF